MVWYTLVDIIGVSRLLVDLRQDPKALVSTLMCDSRNLRMRLAVELTRYPGTDGTPPRQP